MNYPPTPQRKACNCSDPCISTDDVYYAGPNLPNSGINTYNVLTSVIEKLDAIYAVPTLQKVTETGNITTLPIVADSFVKIGGDGSNILLDDGTVLPIGDLPTGVTETSQLINDGEDGINPFITALDIPAFNPSDYDLDEFTNLNVDPFAHLSDIPAPLGYVPVNKAGDTMLGDLILNQDPSTALQAATKQYVDNIVSGINFHPPVVVATDVPLVATYDNGIAGVGATLTGPSVGVLMIDGENPTYLQRILVWQQADPIQNGVYDLTTVGDNVTVYQLTRSSDADNSPPGEIHYGDYTLVLSGDTNGGFGFICNTPGTIDIGITPINYIQFNAAQAVTAGYGLQEAVSNVISIDPLVTQEKIILTTTGSGAATLVSNTLNIPTLPSFLEYNETDKTVWNNGKGNINSNTTFGGSSLINLSTSINNTAFGFNSLSTLSNGGNNNTAIGVSSLSTNNNEASTAVGSQTMFYNTGGYNTAVGSNALYTGSGSSNVAIGVSSLQDITTGSNNVAIGASSGRDILVMNSSVFIGQSSIPLASGQTNQIVIGQGATGAGSNTATLGNDSITSTILKGLVTAPLTTNALIDADTTGKAVVTKEYLSTTSYWTKTGDDIQNNNIGNTKVKILATKQFQLLNSANTIVGYIDETGIGKFGAGSTYTSFGPASANIHLNMVRTQMNANFTLGNPQVSQPFSIISTNYFGTSYVAGSAEVSASAVAEHSFNIGNSVGNGITSGIFRISRTRVQSTVPVKYATDLSANYDNRTLVDKGYVDSKRPYKVYTALLTRTGATAPTEIVLENTIGTITFSYSNTGIYYVNSSGLFTLNKTTIFLQQQPSGSFGNNLGASATTVNEIVIVQTTSAGPNDSNWTFPVSIEIRVYN